MNEKLYQQIEYAYNNYPPIRRLYTEQNVQLSRNMSFESLPYINKAILSCCSFDELFAVPVNRLSRIFTSSGTTGEKHYVAYTANDWNAHTAILARSFACSGLTADDVFYDCIPKSPVFGGHIPDAAVDALGAAVIPAGKMDMQEHLKMICTVKPTALNGLSFFILKAGGLLPDEIRSCIRRIYLVGECLYPLIREKIQEQFPNAELFSGYGISEMCANNECPDHSGFCYDREEYIVEIADPDENGVGEIVFTSLFSEAMPLIRYRTGDKGRIVSADENSTKIEVLGRLDNMINIKGKLVDKDELKKTIYSCKGVEFAYLEYYPLEDSRIELHYTGKVDETVLAGSIKQKFDITPGVYRADAIDTGQWKTQFVRVIC